MFTTIAFFSGALIAWWVGRLNNKDREEYDRLNDEDVKRALLLHIRQDLKLVAFALLGIMVMFVADNIRGGFHAPHF
jgi:hypothetical protein